MKRALIISALLLGSCSLGSCSYTFDTEAPTLPLVGTVPDTPNLPHLNTAPVSTEIFVLGADNRIWIILEQEDQTWRMVPMSGDASTVETLPMLDTDLFVTWRALYITKHPKSTGGVATAAPADMSAPEPVQLTVRSIGESPGHTFEMPGGAAVLFSMGEDDVFAYLVLDDKLPGYIIQRRDESFRRIVPWPKGIDPRDPFRNGAFFSDPGAGDLFFDRDGDGRLVAHHTRDNLDVDLGIRPRFLGFYDARTLVTCGNDGVRVVPIDGFTPERILDDEPCKPQLLTFTNGYVYYDVGTTLKKARIDGSAPPESVYDFGINRLLLLSTPTDIVLYSTDPADRYVRGAGDGWLGNWRFMERGSSLTMSGDRKRIRWLEHSAQGSGIGDLTMVTLDQPGMPGGVTTPLTRNTRSYSILPDGRILCDENRANPGVWNRIVAVDPVRGHKQWVATSANRFSAIPQSNDYIVDVISGATGHDVVRVKIPPVDPTPPPNK
ncbi:MAG: hypothetical protein JWN44_2646 [Myxococcales bacterium]|nr:hypothetical protein [Myxococcales bacterium]